MRGQSNILMSLLVMVLLAGCSWLEKKDEKTEEKQAAEVTGVSESDSSAVVSPASELGKINGIAIDQKDSPDSVRTIYFEYDSSHVRAEFIPVIVAHARLLASDSNRKIALEGHADERGSREYNIALGERRAISVQRLLLGNGAGSGQIHVVSYGEERPAQIGHDESSWSLNRRAEIRYE